MNLYHLWYTTETSWNSDQHNNFDSNSALKVRFTILTIIKDIQPNKWNVFVWNLLLTMGRFQSLNNISNNENEFNMFNFLQVRTRCYMLQNWLSFKVTLIFLLHQSPLRCWIHPLKSFLQHFYYTSCVTFSVV